MGVMEVFVLVVLGSVGYAVYRKVRKEDGSDAARAGQVRPIGVLIGLALLMPGLYIFFIYVPEHSARGGDVIASVANALDSSILTSQQKLVLHGIAGVLCAFGIVQLLAGSRYRKSVGPGD